MPGPIEINEGLLDTLPKPKQDKALRLLREYEHARKANPLLFYQPHSKQRIFHAFNSKNKIFIGGNQSGKTTCGSIDCIIQAIDESAVPEHLRQFKKFRPPFRAWIAGNTREVVEMVIFQKLQEWVPVSQLVGDSWQSAYDKQLHTLHFKNGSTFAFKCFRPDQRALLPDNTYKPVGELQVGDEVETRFGPKKVTAMEWYDDAPMLRIRGRWGYEIVSTPNHKHLVGGEWVEARDIKVGDVLETREVHPLVGGPSTMTETELGWLAILIGDGCLRAITPQFSAAKNAPNLNELPPLPPGTWLRKVEGVDGRCDTWFLADDAHKANRTKEWLKDIGLWGLGSHDKFVPSEVFTQPQEARTYFLRHLYGCDGTIDPNRRAATYVTVSRRLAFDVKYLLRGLGYFPTIVRSPRPNGTAYMVTLTGNEGARFIQEIGKAGYDRSSNPSKQKKRHEPGQVFEITELPPGKVCCPTIEDVNELTVDGIVTHNTYEQEEDKWGGASVDRVMLDEEPPAGHLREARIRTMAREGDLVFTFTPTNGISHMYDWLSPYIEKADQNADHVEDPDVAIVLVEMDDNPALSEREKNLALVGFSKEQVLARKLGRFVALHGLIYNEFEPDRHVIPAMDELPPNVNVIVGIDPGIRHACGVLWAYVAQDGTIVEFEEGYYKDMTIAQVCEEIHKTNAHYGIQPLFYVIDPAARNRASQTGRSDQMEFMDHGVTTILGQNSVTAGINNVKVRLENDALLTTENCENLIREKKRYRWRKPGRSESDAPDAPVKKDDHVLDPERYICMARPYAPKLRAKVNETEIQRSMRTDWEKVTKPPPPAA